MSAIKVTVTDAAGNDWQGQMAEIERTSLGTESHGVMTLMLHLKGDSWGVGSGGMVLDGTAERGAERPGTAYGMDLIATVLRTVGVHSWEQLPGEKVIALHEGPHAWGSINRGIASFDGSRVLIYEQHAQVWRDLEGVVR